MLFILRIIHHIEEYLQLRYIFPKEFMCIINLCQIYLGKEITSLLIPLRVHAQNQLKKIPTFPNPFHRPFSRGPSYHGVHKRQLEKCLQV